MSTTQHVEIQALKSTVEHLNSFIHFLKKRAEKREIHHAKVVDFLLQNLASKSSELHALQDSNEDLRDTIAHLTRQNVNLTRKLTRPAVDMPHNAKHDLDAVGRCIIQDDVSRMTPKM